MLLLRRLVSVLILCSLLVGSAYIYTYFNPFSFPVVPPGTFHGKIHLDGTTIDRAFIGQVIDAKLPQMEMLFLDSTDEHMTLQLERVKPFWFEKIFESVEAVVSPPLIALNEHTYELRGRADKDAYRGYIFKNNERLGSWSLMPVELPPYPAADMQNPQILSTLQGEARLRILQEELRTVRERVREQEQSVAKTKAFIQDEHALKVRAEEQRAKLLSDVTALREERKNGSQDIARLSAELNLLGRITKRGRIAELARKVAARENKWYFVNWHAEEDASGAEEYLDDQYRGNLQNLAPQYQRASEIKNLLQEIQDEQTRIRDLEAQVVAPKQNDTDQELLPKNQQGGFFNRLFGVN